MKFFKCLKFKTFSAFQMGSLLNALTRRVQSQSIWKGPHLKCFKAKTFKKFQMGPLLNALTWRVQRQTIWKGSHLKFFKCFKFSNIRRCPDFQNWFFVDAPLGSPTFKLDFSSMPTSTLLLLTLQIHSGNACTSSSHKSLGIFR